MRGYVHTLSCKELITVNTKHGIETHKTSYCKQRWCPSCERIRMGKYINRYMSIFESMDEPMFVTLTKVAVPAADGSKSLNFMLRVIWRKILKSKGAKRRREQGILGFRGIRKIECTISDIPGHLHIHFHILIDGYDNAEWLRAEWLREMGNLAKPVAQKIKRADKGSLIELCKYFTKSAADLNEITDYKMLDTIYQVFRNVQLIRGFGGIEDVSDDIDSDVEAEVEGVLLRIEEGEFGKPTPEQVQEDWDEETNVLFIYNRKRTDWFSTYDEPYSGFTPNEKEVQKYEIETDQEIIIKPSGVRLDPAVWLNKWPDLEDTARNGVGTAGKQP